MRITSIILLLLLISTQGFSQLKLNDKEYFETQGLSVMSFSDFYPDGHQGGVTIIQHGSRTAANGDVRLETDPGQWSPIPKVLERFVDEEASAIVTRLQFPDEEKDMRGFNPIKYPNLELTYEVRVTAEGNKVQVHVDLDKPLPEAWAGRAGFNLELFPGDYFGSSYMLGGSVGKFQRQVGQAVDEEGTHLPLAEGKLLTVAPEDPKKTIRIASHTGNLVLYDGRARFNNGWFVVRSGIEAGATKDAVVWTITPNVVEGWKYDPVIQISQVGFTTGQQKKAVVEIDKTETVYEEIRIVKYDADGHAETVRSGEPEYWGEFLQYGYLTYDFSDVTEPGIYRVYYGELASNSFEIADDVFQRSVWQPTIDYFMPVQMCHMRVNDRYRVWHGLCHDDDALMAPVDHWHFDGYRQGETTMSEYQPGDHVPGLNVGGWHDAGDYDLRLNSQATTTQLFAMLYEEFGLTHDNTTVNQETKTVELNRPDGIPDVLQQVEHGALTILGGYRAFGRFYRGIIVPSLRQYTHLGDAATMTDGKVKSGSIEQDHIIEGKGLQYDDRLVFTRDDARWDMTGIAALAAAARVLPDYKPELAEECIEAAESMWELHADAGPIVKAAAAVELYRTTKDQKYLNYINENIEGMMRWPQFTLGALSRLYELYNAGTQEFLLQAVKDYQAQVVEEEKNTPYGISYEPNIWGAGWEVQNFGVNQYLLNKAFPEIVSKEYMHNALNFVLGAHPGSNNASFVSGVGVNSLLTAYGVNRGDWSHIPGGVASGTNLVRPDFPELKHWPFFWQQGEYMISHAALNFVILALAAE